MVPSALRVLTWDKVPQPAEPGIRGLRRTFFDPGQHFVCAERCDGDERTGVRILQRALQAPARQIAENSAVDGGVVVSRMLDSEGAIGFDAARNAYVDLIEAGIVDPTKVVRIALENAVSVASVLLLTEATMTEIPEKEREGPATPEMGL
ncbi:TCP-1/cpn60 chaperonin family protein [Arhodomonas sp. AD133]|uniref:TCP-1/cpn60 chaperonin family protein n=1 Tax=Arhodomonas sp. AD133 TaxID=3415009 RepID=UPI003EBA4DED